MTTPGSPDSERDAMLAAAIELYLPGFRRAAKGRGGRLDDAALTGLFAGIDLAWSHGGPATGSPPAIEIRVALERTREFGLVLSAGLGGLDADLAPGSFSADQARICAIAELTDARDFLDRFRPTFAYRKLAAMVGDPRRSQLDATLASVLDRLLVLAAAARTPGWDSGCVPDRVTLTLAPGERSLVITAASAEAGVATAARRPRPIHKIEAMLHPKSIGLVGVSATSMNFGRIILRNLMGSGYPKDQLSVIRPGETEVDGVGCVPTLADLPQRLDLLIVAVAADAVYALVDEIIATDAAQAVMLIPGSLGETQKSREPAAALAARINAAHERDGGGPVFLGANCLGIVSHPGRFDSWFIPLERLPKPQKKAERNSVLLSQSGAFMITRISANPWLDPAYMIAVGNQTDLTHGDLLRYFAGRPSIETIGVYIEGFKDGDGLDFAHAVRECVANGKDVVVYKAGRTRAGAGGVMGHTASIAGDPDVFSSVVRHAGAMVATDFATFDDLLYIAGALHHKKLGPRLGAISGAGFEAVGIADASVTASFAMTVGTLAPETETRVRDVLVAKRLDALVEVRNPIDINPGADDEAHLAIVEAFLQDPGIDAVVVGLDPTAPSIRALESSKLRPGYDISDPKSTVHLMPPLAHRYDKPVIGIVDGGHLYDAMAAGLMDRDVCVFRNCGRGTKALALYTEARQRADAMRARLR